MEEYTKILEELQREENVRENLSRVRQMLKENEQKSDSKAKEESLFLQKQLEELCCGFLKKEDPKVRKNAALLLGDLAKGKSKETEWKALAQNLWESYEREETLFVKSAYLKALSACPAQALERLWDKVLARQKELETSAPLEEEVKHIRQEKRALEGLTGKLSGTKKAKKAKCCYPKGTVRVMLLCEPGIREKLAQETALVAQEIKILASGVAVTTTRIPQVLCSRLYREAWLIVRQKKGCVADREHLANATAASELLLLLQSCYPPNTSFSFRIRLMGADDLKRKADFVQKTAYALETESGGRLKNRPDDYEAEIIFREKKDGRFAIFVKITGWEDRRFSYRKRVQPTSMHPSAAAAVASLAEPYLKEDVQVIDPFCGVGTLLVERACRKRAKYMYGTDIFGDAIKDARENVRLAVEVGVFSGSGAAKGVSEEVYLINRDYFDFTSAYLFDEIITEMPRFYGKSSEEVNAFFKNFFAKSAEILREEGVLIFLTEEENQVKKQLRLSKQLRLERQMEFRGKEKVYIVYRR